MSLAFATDGLFGSAVPGLDGLFVVLQVDVVAPPLLTDLQVRPATVDALQLIGAGAEMTLRVCPDAEERLRVRATPAERFRICPGNNARLKVKAK